MAVHEDRWSVVSAQWDDEMTSLVEMHGRALVGYAYALCGDVGEAEDLVQEALFRVYSRFRRPASATPSAVHPLEDGPSQDGGARAYVRRTVLNLYVDGYRKRRTWDKHEPVLATQEWVGGPATGVTARADITAALGRLSPRQRACVLLRYYDDLTVPQIAEALGCAQGTVKRYLSDALGALRGVLEPEGELR